MVPIHSPETSFAETEGHSGRVPHFDARGVERMRQGLAAPLRGRGNGVPARLRPGAVGLLPSRCRGDDAVLEARAVAVADRVEGAENIGRELACFPKHRLDHVVGEVAVQAFGQRRAETGCILERKGNIGNRRPVGHRLLSGGARFCPGRTASNSCGAHALRLGHLKARRSQLTPSRLNLYLSSAILRSTGRT